jgi:hypothetical protein
VSQNILETSERTMSNIDLPAQQHYDCVTLGGDKAEHKYVLGATVVAFWRGFSKRALCVQDDFLMFGADEMIHNVGCGGVPASVTEPLGTNETFDDGSRRVYAAVAGFREG